MELLRAGVLARAEAQAHATPQPAHVLASLCRMFEHVKMNPSGPLLRGQPRPNAVNSRVLQAEMLALVGGGLHALVLLGQGRSLALELEVGRAYRNCTLAQHVAFRAARADLAALQNYVAHVAQARSVPVGCKASENSFRLETHLIPLLAVFAAAGYDGLAAGADCITVRTSYPIDAAIMALPSAVLPPPAHAPASSRASGSSSSMSSRTPSWAASSSVDRPHAAHLTPPRQRTQSPSASSGTSSARWGTLSASSSVIIPPLLSDRGSMQPDGRRAPEPAASHASPASRALPLGIPVPGTAGAARAAEPSRAASSATAGASPTSAGSCARADASQTAGSFEGVAVRASTAVWRQLLLGGPARAELAAVQQMTLEHVALEADAATLAALVRAVACPQRVAEGELQRPFVGRVGELELDATIQDVRALLRPDVHAEPVAVRVQGFALRAPPALLRTLLEPASDDAAAGQPPAAA